MILELSDSIGEDVHEVLDPIMLQSLSYQSLSCLDVDVQEISSINLCLKWLEFVDVFRSKLCHLDYEVNSRKIV